MEFFVIIVNSIAKSPILDVPGISGYIIVIMCFWLRRKCGDRKFLTLELFLLFLVWKEAHGAGKINQR